jgi:hypothetical protein
MARQKRTGQHSYRVGDRVILCADPEEGWERQEARILATQPKRMYTVEVEPEDERDDGLREITEDQIEGRL